MLKFTTGKLSTWMWEAECLWTARGKSSSRFGNMRSAINLLSRDFGGFSVRSKSLSYEEGKRIILEELRPAYEELIEQRRDDLKLPENQRSMTDAEFRRKERELEFKGRAVRRAANIQMGGEAIPCRGCGGLFEYMASMGYEYSLKNCETHERSYYVSRGGKGRGKECKMRPPKKLENCWDG